MNRHLPILPGLQRTDTPWRWHHVSAWLAICLLSLSPFLAGCRESTGNKEVNSLIIYTSQDQVYAEKVFQEFTDLTGIKIKAKFDNESVKTMGLAKRLLAERDHPKCDIFWSNESLAARKLFEAGVAQSFLEIGHRARVMIINTNLMQANEAPKSMRELTHPKWKNKLAIAYPLFGTTATHVLALRQLWGQETWEEWCRGLVKNKIKILDGNSMVVRMVGMGEAWIGLTDSDDLAIGLGKALPLASVPLKHELCAIPNTVTLIQGAPNPMQATVFVDYIRQEQVLERMVQRSALISTKPPPVNEDFLDVKWPEIMGFQSETFQTLRTIFIR